MTFLSVPPHLDWPVQFCVFVSLETWVHSLVTGNVSQVDRLWTFLPTIYSAYFALLPLLPNEQPFWLVPYAPKELGYQAVKDLSPRAVLMLALIATWMCRLSYNTWRRGLFLSSEEDYRWEVLRQKLHPILFQITNLTFIAFTQNILLLILALPVYTASVLQPHTALTTSDYGLAALSLVVLALEFTADNQQFAFHAFKHAVQAEEKKNKSVTNGDSKPLGYDASAQWPGARLNWQRSDAKRGFITRGLWRYSRHPNFACEQKFWHIMMLFPLLCSAPSYAMSTPATLPLPLPASFLFALPPAIRLIFPHIIPSLVISALFYSSTLFTESITAAKYAGYKSYQRHVGMFEPFFSTIVLETLRSWFWVDKNDNFREELWGNPTLTNDKTKKVD
ncbi:integral membrane protein [Crepidotus variabilis]|uniref:Integral membrane protein n=1 Tax=Crepidotus variabilis TaxID=179855 RepID=A0A9P6JMR9_9AGAR|nr:integral membrane protein [Crepidotus variabilis]